MNRTKRLKLNSITALTNQIVRIISGLILPRLILLYFGSETNGLVASIRQFLSIITFLDLGVGSVVQAALYRPLSRNDKNKISGILSSARSYFQKIAYALIFYVGLLILLYPVFIDSSFNFLSTVFLILALSISLFGQYYFGIVNELLLNANQQAYIQYASEIIVVILNLIVSIILIVQGASIQFVQLGAGLVFLIRPVILSWYVNKHFNIDYKYEGEKDYLPQKWSGVGQHIAYTIQNSTDIVILSLFSTLADVSIYTVYNMVTQAIRTLLSSLTTGMGSFFGNLLANEEVDLMNNYFDRIEWVIHTGVVFLYGMTAVLIDSFVMLYTHGVDDVNYKAPVFSFLIVISMAVYSIRIPYRSIIFSAGHFKQTQVSSFIEAGLNIVISGLLVNSFGLVGIAIGTLTAIGYHTIYSVLYLSKNIVYRPVKIFIKHIFVDILSMSLIMLIGMQFSNLYHINTILDLFIAAIILGLANLVPIIIINYMFYRRIVLSILKGIFKK